jgi:hypothetical protein
MAIKATLTYFDQGTPLVTVVLDSPVTIVGRGAPEVRDLPEVVEKVSKREPFQVRQGGTLFIGIPSDLRLARSHFAIRRAVGESGEVVFLVRDLNSYCGFMVNNDARTVGSPEMQLNGGDRIHYGFEFVFDVVGRHDVQDA